MGMPERQSFRTEEEYLSALVSQIRCKKARSLVAEELAAHIQDQKEALMEAGMDEEAALAESVRQMGDPLEVGMEMDRIHRPRLDLRLLALIAVLSLAGLFLQYQIGGLAESAGFADGFARHCLGTGLGLAVMAAVYFLDYTLVERYALPLWLLLSGWLMASGFLSPHVNGSRSYTQISLYLYVPVFAGLLCRARRRGAAGFAACLFLLALTVLLGVGTCGTLNVPFFLALVCLMMITAAVGWGWFPLPRRRTILLLWGGAALVPVLYAALGGLSAYQAERLRLLLSPAARQVSRYTADYAAANVRELLHASRLAGNAGLPAGQLLPSLSSDYVFTFAVSSYGILAGIALAAALAFLAARILGISRRQTNQLGRMISLGCGLVFAVEAAHYILANCGISLLSQTWLPFFSSGLRASLVTYVFAGLLLSVRRFQDVAGTGHRG